MAKKILLLSVICLVIGIGTVHADDIPSAYGEHVLTPNPDGSYVIHTANGEVLGPQDEIPFAAIGFPGCETLRERVDTTPVLVSHGGLNPHFQVIMPNQAMTVADNLCRRCRTGFLEPMESLPNFLQINDEFLPLSVEFVGIDPGGHHVYYVSWITGDLLLNGRDKIKFLSPYQMNGYNAVLEREYAIRHDRNMWAMIDRERSASNLSVFLVSPEFPNRVRYVVTNLPIDAQVSDYFFIRQGRNLMIVTDAGNVLVDTSAGLPPHVNSPLQSAALPPVPG